LESDAVRVSPKPRETSVKLVSFGLAPNAYRPPLFSVFLQTAEVASGDFCGFALSNNTLVSR
jgi:hypothetical protein